MSRRYGRNQKRAAARRIEQLERTRDYWVDRHGRDTMELAQTVLQQRRALDSVCEALGPNFVGLPPEGLAHRVWMLANPEGWKLAAPGRNVTMHTMEYKSRHDSAAYEDRLHFRVILAGRQVGYALSEPALRHAPVDFLAHRIGDEMARLLVNDLRNAQTGGLHGRD